VTPELQRRIEEAARVLRQGGLVAYPTETFYGLGALASCAPALARLAAAKLRPEGKPLPLLAATPEAALALAAAVTPLARRLAERFWPGPLTLVLAAAPGLAGEITAGSGTVAVRVPASEVARALSRLAGGPLVSTSANLTGGPPPTRVEDLDPALSAGIDLVLDAGPTPGGHPSTLVDVTGSTPRLVRAGAVSWAEVEAGCAP